MKQLQDIPQEILKFLDGTLVVTADANIYSYYFLTREKKSHPWKATAFARSPGDCCLAKAQKFFEENGFPEINYSLGKVVDGFTWKKFQTTQHLKQIRRDTK